MENRQPTQRDIAISTLENKVLQGVLGSNQILEKQSLYGQLAVDGAKNAYNETMNSEEARVFKDALYEKKLADGKRLGVYGVPSINDYDVSTEIIKQLEENKLRLSLGDLGEVVKNIAGSYNYDFEVPRELSKYVPLKLKMKRQMAEINPEENALTEKENDALDVYQLLSQAYNRGASLRTCNYFADLNDFGKKIMEKYKQPEKEKKEKE